MWVMCCQDKQLLGAPSQLGAPEGWQHKCRVLKYAIFAMTVGDSLTHPTKITPAALRSRKKLSLNVTEGKLRVIVFTRNRLLQLIMIFDLK